MIKDKRAQIAALLNKANAKGVSKAESESLTQKAIELMNKYQIEEAEVRAIDPNAQAKARIESRSYLINNKAQRGQFRKAAIVTVVNAYGARLVQRKYSDGSFILTVLATVSTLDMLDLLIPSLLEQIEYQTNKASRAYVKDLRAKYSDSAYIYAQAVEFRKDFTQFYGVGVADMVEKAQREAEGRAGALVLVGDKARVEEEFQNLFGDLKKARKPRERRVNAKGANGGYEAGTKANLVGVARL